MILGDIPTLLSRQKQQVHRERMVRQILQIMIAMVSGLAVGLAVISCFTKKYERQPNEKLKKKTEETAETVMDTVENIRDKTECVKENIESGYENFKQDAHEVADKISNLYDETSE